MYVSNSYLIYMYANLKRCVLIDERVYSRIIAYLVFLFQMTWVKAFIVCLCLSGFLSVNAAKDLGVQTVGNVRHTHFYYEGDVLKGICVASEEGMIALLDHLTGNIVWRNYAAGGRKLQRFVAQGRCKRGYKTL